METITSVSGGKTSSYMALHYPTDYYIFELVRIEDKRCTPKDKESGSVSSIIANVKKAIKENTNTQYLETINNIKNKLQ